MSWTIDFNQGSNETFSYVIRDGEIGSIDVPGLRFSLHGLQDTAPDTDASWQYTRDGEVDGVTITSPNVSLLMARPASFNFEGLRIYTAEPMSLTIAAQLAVGTGTPPSFTFEVDGIRTLTTEDLAGFTGLRSVWFSTPNSMAGVVLDNFVVDLYTPPPNVAPSGADALITLNEDTPRTLTAGDFGFSDTDGNALKSVMLTNIPTAGKLRLDGTGVHAGDEISAADIAAGKLIYTPAADGSGTAYATLTFQVRDDGGVANAGADLDATPNTLTFDVSAVNDRPVIGGLAGSAVFQEGLNDEVVEPIRIAPDITIVDVDNPALFIASVSLVGFVTGQDVLSFTNGPGMGDIQGVFTGPTGPLTLTSTAGASPAEFQAALRAVTYFNTSDSPSVAARNFVFRISDGVANAQPMGRTLEVRDTDDTPSGADATLSLEEGANHVFSAADFGFTDIDGGTLKGVTLTTLPDAGTLTLDGAGVTAGQVVTRADIDAGKLVYAPPADTQGHGAPSFTFQVMDDLGEDITGQPVDQSPNTLTFDLNPANDPPVISGMSGSVIFQEGLNGEVVSPISVAPDIVITDVDSATLSQGQVSITTNFVRGEDVLSFTNGPGMGDISGAFNSRSGIFTLGSPGGGATAAEWQAALRAVKYFNTSETPSTAPRTVVFAIRDHASLESAPATRTLEVRGTDDTPSGADATVSLSANASHVFAAGDFGFTDIDGGTLKGVTITTLPNGGALTLDGAAVAAGQIVTRTDIDAGKLVYAPPANAYGHGVGSFKFQVMDDLGEDITGQPVDQSPNILTFDVAGSPPAPDPDPPSPPTPPPAPVVDGVPVTTTTGTSPSGTPTQTVTIPVVTSSRPDTVGGNNVADIPIVAGTGTGAPPVLSVQAPPGYGLTASGQAAAQTAGASLTDLIREIQAHTAAGSSDQTALTGAGGGFLGALPSNAPLLVQTLAPTGGGPTAQPLVINGGSGAAGGALTALVIDTSGLTAGSTIELNDVDFAAVVGAVTVIGGAGSQTVYGDGASQTLFLGADDDVLHGGGGTDTVASAGGNDQLYGDEGSDSVSGGIGDDFVHGNAGADTVSGGDGNDAAYGGKDDDRISGDAGSDLVWGDLGDDFLHGNSGSDTVDGGAGNDSVHGGQDNDYVSGGDGDDVVLGDLGDDFVQGGVGNDQVLGGAGNDVVHGGQGDDWVHGDDGDDWLSGDRGNDTLTGGTGADSFHAYAQTGRDVVLDFNAAEGDRVVIDMGDAYTVSQDADGVLIAFSAEHQMLLKSVQLSTLAEGWIVGG